jgi:predicted transcriptional regulator
MAEQNASNPPSVEPHRPHRTLGTLEAQLMEALWASVDLSVQGVVDRIGEGHNYKTVMTVLNRLVDKELLERHLDGRAYLYSPMLARDAFLRSAADELVGGYLQTFGAAAASHLAGAVDAVAPRSAPVAQPAPQRTIPLEPVPAGPSRLAKLATAAAILEAVVFLFSRRRNRKS